ncbi:hypothetical protein IQ279_03685 [Streptomyces verrucosisporus]|uniref:hypothetical protein n=1 Tax=Streptomyces verrucosisporus TaxID=1695161 RepID=UPI0019CFE189|nr:hypothetical protein [Streptomyces verrucosisporus]MBN3928752.1 hypothetical protein [Streptomyces verrucosisporus]
MSSTEAMVARRGGRAPTGRDRGYSRPSPGPASPGFCSTTVPCCRCERRFAPLPLRSEEYQSVACRLGQHRACRDGEVAEPPCEGVTLLRCSCPCHARAP